MSDVFDVLGQDHAEVKQMLDALETSPGQAEGASSAVLAARGKLAEMLVINSSKHEAAEEQYFWPAVRQHLPNGDELADHAIGQESEAKEALAKLDKLDSSDPEFDKLVAGLIPSARQHIQFEETQVWPGLRQILTTAQAEALGEQVRHAEEHGPTSPHPSTPANPTVLTTAGPVAALIDRLRDALTGRG